MPATVLPGGLLDVQGFLAQGVAAGVKRKRPDLALIASTVPAACAGVFTTNRVKAAPVLVSKPVAASGKARAIVVNAGCANACTGGQGFLDAEEMQTLTAECLQVLPGEVLVASTGVIGRHLPMDLIREGIRNAAGTLHEGTPGAVAQAIMTTDTTPKEVLVQTEIAGVPVRIAGVAKGSGMIHPDMATMLAFVVTDAVLSPAVLRSALKAAVNDTFNMITVDGDTSTNDMVAALANGLAGNPEIPEDLESPGYSRFLEALTLACRELAVKIARDGEGATTLLEVRVTGAATREDARSAARAIARSSLVKTAVHGRDPNWGRVLAALGASGASFDPGEVSLSLGNPTGRARIVEAGEPCRTLDADGLRHLLRSPHVILSLDLHAGPREATAWGCDLTPDYVKINAEYTT